LRQLHLVLGVFPDALETVALDTDGETALVATNVTSSLMMQRIEDIYRSLTHFNHLVIDLAHFGETRNQQSRDALVIKLRELGFAEVERVYSTSDTDIRHFRHEGAVPQAPLACFTGGMLFRRRPGSKPPGKSLSRPRKAKRS